MTTSDDRAVADHYLAYPYPARDPADEAKRLIEGSPSRLVEVAHYVFGGRTPDPFRALVAGGGAGDGAIMLAQHMTDAGVTGEVVWLDLSPAAQAIAEARAKARGLNNIRFVEGSLLAARAHVGNGFDYIDCCGVLHHLAEPEAGLASLRDVLNDTGGMGLMVYGALGRRGVYDMQAATAALAPHDMEPAARLALGQKLFQALPASNWLKRNPFVRDHLDGGDAGFYDLLLHARDRAYTVEDFSRLIASADMSVVSYIESALYDPAVYLNDPDLKRRQAALPPLERAALAERLSGAMTKHVVYAAPTKRAAEAAARPDDARLTPVIKDGASPGLAEAARAGRIAIEHRGTKIVLALPRLAPAILRRIDGRATLDAIFTDIQAADSGLDWPRFQQAFATVFTALNSLNLMWLTRLT